MQIFALFMAIFALVSSAVALRHPNCGLKPYVNGDGKRSGGAYFKRWSYDSASNECVEFTYGGWFGNNNRFKSQKDCEDMCKEKNFKIK